MALEKAGKIAEGESDWPKAAEFYLMVRFSHVGLIGVLVFFCCLTKCIFFGLQVVDVRETEGQQRTMKKALTKAIQMCIKAHQLQQALELLRTLLLWWWL